MARPIRITVTSEALGVPRMVVVHVYPTLKGMRCAATKFHPDGPVGSFSEAAGVCQLWTSKSDATHVTPVVRLVRGHLGSEAVSHEMHHAATAIYGAFAGDSAELTHYNEPFAYLFSDLFSGLVDALYGIGAYD